MPRALIVTYQWLPIVSAAVKHVANLCRYLPAAGWEPHILTKDWSDGPAPEDAVWGATTQQPDASPSLTHALSLPVVRAPYALRDNRWLQRHARLKGWTRRALDVAYPLYGHYPDMHRGWAEPAVAAGLTAVRQYGIGAVVSVCPPATSHIVGGEIARRAGIPWIVLFEDLAVFHHGPGDGHSRLVRWEHRLLTKRWLHGASRSACISPRMVEYVRDAYGVSGDVVVVPFDPDERRVAPHRTPGSPLRIVHTGSIDPTIERPDLVFDALDALVCADPGAREEITVDLVGSRCDEWLTGNLHGRPCEPMVHVVARGAPADEARLQREADVLLTFTHQMIEQWNAGRPTIAVATASGGFCEKLLAETGVGEAAGDASDLRAILERFLSELRTTGAVVFHGDDAAIARYGAPEQAKRLGGLLDAASAERFGSWQRARN